MKVLLLLLALVGPPCVKRDSNGVILRSWSVTHAFKLMTGYPLGRTGYVVDHVIPLCACGPDTTANLQWQRYDSSLAKDKMEGAVCRALTAWATPLIDTVYQPVPTP